VIAEHLAVVGQKQHDTAEARAIDRLLL